MAREITHLVACDERTAPDTPRVAVSMTQFSGPLFGEAVTDPRPLSFDAAFANNAVAAGVTDLAIPHAGVTGGEYAIPAGWNAVIHRITLWTSGDGDDITAATAKLYVDGQDASADFTALTLDPSQVEAADVGPLVPPYVVVGSLAAPSSLGVRVTTNGTGGTMGFVVHALGLMYKVL